MRGRAGPWRDAWERASELPLSEHVYLLTSHTTLTRGEAMDLPAPERHLTVARVLMDLDREDLKYNNLVRTMIRLWTVK